MKFAFEIEIPVLVPGVDIVGFDLRIQSCRVQAEEAGGAGLVAAGLF